MQRSSLVRVGEQCCETGADFDAVEVSGKHPGSIDQVGSLTNTLDLPVVGRSDAHFPFEAGRTLTSSTSG